MPTNLLPAQLKSKNQSDAVELKAKAKDAYFSYRNFNEIAQTLGVSTSQLARWRKEDSWLIEREAIERGLIEDGFATRKLSIARILNSTTDQIERGLRHLVGRQEPPSLGEMEKLSTILGNLDRVGRLDSGKPTDNVAVAAKLEMTAEGIRKIILSDPARAFEPPQVEVVIDVSPQQ